MASNVDGHNVQTVPLYTHQHTHLKTQKFWLLRILCRQCSLLGNITDADAQWENLVNSFFKSIGEQGSITFFGEFVGLDFIMLGPNLGQL